jgi:hypothetical protein
VAARLDAGIPARTALWLAGLREYADADSGPGLLGRLADLLEGEDRLSRSSDTRAASDPAGRADSRADHLIPGGPDCQSAPDARTTCKVSCCGGRS